MQTRYLGDGDGYIITSPWVQPCHNTLMMLELETNKFQRKYMIYADDTTNIHQPCIKRYSSMTNIIFWLPLSPLFMAEIHSYVGL